MIVGLIQLRINPVEQLDPPVKGYLFPLKIKIIEPSLQRGRNVVSAAHYGSTVMMLTMVCEDRGIAWNALFVVLKGAVAMFLHEVISLGRL